MVFGFGRDKDSGFVRVVRVAAKKGGNGEERKGKGEEYI